MRTNESYKILLSQTINDNEEIVLARGYFDYACWYYNKERDDYFWGFYSEHRKDAMEKFKERVSKRSKIESSLKREVPYTSGEIFDVLIMLLDKKELLPSDLNDINGFIDYAISDRDGHTVTDIDWYLDCRLNYGGSEGIYLDVSLVTDNERVKAGTIKTLKDDRDAMYKMAKLQADLLVESEDWRWKNRKELEWSK